MAQASRPSRAQGRNCRCGRDFVPCCSIIHLFQEHVCGKSGLLRPFRRRNRYGQTARRGAVNYRVPKTGGKHNRWRPPVAADTVRTSPTSRFHHFRAWKAAAEYRRTHHEGREGQEGTHTNTIPAVIPAQAGMTEKAEMVSRVGMTEGAGTMNGVGMTEGAETTEEVGMTTASFSPLRLFASSRFHHFTFSPLHHFTTSPLRLLTFSSPSCSSCPSW